MELLRIDIATSAWREAVKQGQLPLFPEKDGGMPRLRKRRRAAQHRM